MRIDTCMLNDDFFSMGVRVGNSFWCVLKLSEWHESFVGISEFCWNFWGFPNLSSSCDNNYSYVKDVSFRSVIFGRYKMIKKPLRIHAKSLSDALAPSKKNCLRRWPPAALRGFRIPAVPIVCQIFARKAERMIGISLLIAAHFVSVMVHVPSFPFGSPSWTDVRLTCHHDTTFVMHVIPYQVLPIVWPVGQHLYSCPKSVIDVPSLPVSMASFFMCISLDPSHSWFPSFSRACACSLSFFLSFYRSPCVSLMMMIAFIILFLIFNSNPG